MKKLKMIALVTAAMIIFSGCSSMFVKNEDKVKQQAAATVNGVKITRQQVEYGAIASDEYQYYASYYGVTEESINNNKDLKDWYQDLLSRTLEQLAIEELIVQKAPELGISLTEEEKQEQRQAADEQFAGAKEQIRAMVEQEMAPSPSPEASVSPDVSAEPEASVSPDASAAPEVSASPEASVSPEASPAPTPTPDPAVEAEVEKRYQDLLKDAPYNPDTYYESLCRQLIITKVMDHIKNLAAVTDEDVRKWYDESVTAQQTSMDADPTLFATNMNNNQICVYVPEDTVAVKQVLVTFKDKDLAEVAKQSYADGNTEDAMKLLEGQIADLMPTMRDIQQRIKNGESVDALIAEFGEDPGMTSGTAATTGYLVGASTTTYLSEFKKAAQGLTAVGQVSEPVATYYGVHVMQAIKIYKKGTVPFEELKDSIKTALLPTKQQQEYDGLIEKWKKESNISYDKGRLYN